MLYELIYMSQSEPAQLDQRHLEDILRASRRSNADRGITGVLLPVIDHKGCSIAFMDGIGDAPLQANEVVMDGLGARSLGSGGGHGKFNGRWCRPGAGPDRATEKALSPPDGDHAHRQARLPCGRNPRAHRR